MDSDEILELSVEKCKPNCRIGICIDSEGSSSWWIVRPDGSSSSGDIQISQELQQALDEFASFLRS